MRVDRRTFLLGTLVTSLTACSKTSGPLIKAAEYLWAQQASDGGFHSSTYGLLRSGQSLTPFIVRALLTVSDRSIADPGGAMDRAVTFIKANTNADGVLGMMDESAADYPNYATALAISAMVRAKRTGYDRVIEPMLKQLRLQQFTEERGWKENDTPFGGWGMGGPLHHAPDAGHVDLSMTRHVLEAFSDAGVPSTDEVFKRALIFLNRSQNSDGGFLFSPVSPELNKAGPSGSYGTATADGVLALRAAGVADSDPRITKAIGWLRQHHRPDRAPGFDKPDNAGWADGLKFYYAHALARVIPSLTINLPPQADDGSFRNPSNLVKEDDPLIATALAIYVLAR